MIESVQIRAHGQARRLRRRLPSLQRTADWAIRAGVALTLGLPLVLIAAGGAHWWLATVFAVLAALMLLGLLAHPSWRRGPAYLSAMYLCGLGAGDLRGFGWYVLSALLLALVLIATELRETQSWRAGWTNALSQQAFPASSAVVGTAALYEIATVPVRGTVLAVVAVAGAVAATVVVLVWLLRRLSKLIR